MKTRVFGCRKFRRLVSESMDGSVSVHESVFMGRHRRVCLSCRLAEHQSSLALNMLRDAALEAQRSPTFDDRLLRRVRLQFRRAKIDYWSPAMFGAAIAGIAVLAALQMITQTSKLPAVPLSGRTFEARHVTQPTPDFPSLDFLQTDRRPQ